eukprot:COSAG06_NODE_6577_length_2872_cov_5.690003_5_plen_154_part_00
MRNCLCFVHHLTLKTPNLCQDRLGTGTGKVVETRRLFLSVLQVGCIPLRRGRRSTSTRHSSVRPCLVLSCLVFFFVERFPRLLAVPLPEQGLLCLCVFRSGTTHYITKYKTRCDIIQYAIYCIISSLQYIHYIFHCIMSLSQSTYYHHYNTQI